MTENNPVPPEVTEEIPLARPAVLFGREAEIEALMAYLGKLAEGTGGVAGIRGDSGLGKTALTRDITARSASMSLTLIPIHCRGTQHRAFYPLAGLVRAMLGVDHESRSREQFARLEEVLNNLDVSDPDQSLARLLNLHIIKPTGPLDEQAVESEDHFDDTQVGPSALVALPNTLRALVKAWIKRDGPLCVVFDDLDEAHPQTITLFQKLVEVTADLPALWMATFAPNPPNEITAVFHENLITLSNLADEPALALAASLSGVKRVSAKVGEVILRTTAGDPLFLTLLMRDVGGAAGARSGKGDTGALTADSLPSTIVQLLSERAASLGELQRETLECAAVLGDGFRMGALSSQRGRVPVADLEVDLNMLVEKGWLERMGKGRHIHFVFAHRIKRSVIYRGIPEDHRAAMHKQAGDYYAVVSAGNRIRVENATYHYLRSGDAKRALPVVEIAINKARAAGEHDQLAALYKLGLEVTASDPSLNNKQIDLAERLGDLYAGSGDYATAVEMYTHYSPSVTSPAILTKLGLVTMTVDPDRAANILSRSLSVVGNREEDSRWILESCLCWALSISGNNYEAIRRCRDSLGKLGDTVGFGEARTMMRAVLGMILFYEGDIHEANPHLESARAGWGARGKQDGITLINQVLISMPQQDITRGLVKMLIVPLLKE